MLAVSVPCWGSTGGCQTLGCVERGRETHAGLPGLGRAFGRGLCRSASHLCTLPSAFFSSWGQHDRVGADGAMMAMNWASCGWRREQRRFRWESHCQLQASNFGATAGAEAGASEDSQQQMVGWQEGPVVVEAAVRLRPRCSRVAVPGAQQCPGAVPVSVSSAEVGSAGSSCLPRAATARAADGAWVLPSEMVWGAESLFQRSQSHTSGGLRSVAAVGMSLAAAELRGFGRPSHQSCACCILPSSSPLCPVPFLT